MPLDLFHADHGPCSNELRSWASQESKSLTTEADLRAVIPRARPSANRPSRGLVASLACKLILWSGQLFWSD